MADVQLTGSQPTPWSTVQWAPSAVWLKWSFPKFLPRQRRSGTSAFRCFSTQGTPEAQGNAYGRCPADRKSANAVVNCSMGAKRCLAEVELPEISAATKTIRDVG